MELEEGLTKYLSDNVALFDCQGDCPDEESRMMVKPDEYCNKCFAKLIITLVKEDGYVKVRKGDIYWTREQLSAPDYAKEYSED